MIGLLVTQNQKPIWENIYDTFFIFICFIDKTINLSEENLIKMYKKWNTPVFYLEFSVQVYLLQIICLHWFYVQSLK